MLRVILVAGICILMLRQVGIVMRVSISGNRIVSRHRSLYIIDPEKAFLSLSKARLLLPGVGCGNMEMSMPLDLVNAVYL